LVFPPGGEKARPLLKGWGGGREVEFFFGGGGGRRKRKIWCPDGKKKRSLIVLVGVRGGAVG